MKSPARALLWFALLFHGALAVAQPGLRNGGVLVGDGIAPALRAEVERVVPALRALYSALLGGEPRQAPAIHVVWDRRDQEAGTLRADVEADATMRVALIGREWAEPTAPRMASLRGTLAREMAHLWNRGVYSPVLPAPPWLLEGNAELLGTAALLRARLETPEDIARRVNSAFNRCFVSGSGFPWRKSPGKDAGELAYACGFAMQFVALALAQQHDPKLDAFNLWRGFWQKHPRYDAALFVAHLRSVGGEPAAAFLERALAEAQAPLDQLLVSGIDTALGLQLPRAPAPQYAGRILANLMVHDCGGAFGFWTNNDHLFIDDIPGCGFFRSGWKLSRMAGVELLRDPVAAVEAAKSACAAGRPIVFGTLDGVELAKSCDAGTIDALPSDLRVANLPSIRIARVLVRE